MKLQTLIFLLSVTPTLAYAQQPQIPTLQVCNQTVVKGKATVQMAARRDTSHSGTFEINVDLLCNPDTGYPSGSVVIQKLSMTDSVLQGSLSSTSIEQLTSTGRATPIAYLNGRCTADGIRGCKFWMMLTDNKKAGAKELTPDIVSFLVFDQAGKRVAHGTGVVTEGDITVAPTSN